MYPLELRVDPKIVQVLTSYIDRLPNYINYWVVGAWNRELTTEQILQLRNVRTLTVDLMAQFRNGCYVL